MKKNFLYIIAFLSVLVACTEETIEVGTPLTGQEVTFSVSMGNDSRTLYGQEEADGKSIKVNWVNGDKITVYGTTCAVKQSDYSVVAANSGNQNYADNLVKTGAAGIQWGSEASVFYAIYPAVDEKAVEVNNDNGIVTITSNDQEGAKIAKKMISDLTFKPEVGMVIKGKVVRIIPIGAFVELGGGKDGMVHISQICQERIETIEPHVNIGDEVIVKVIKIDDKGRVNLTIKGVTEEDKAKCI